VAGKQPVCERQAEVEIRKVSEVEDFGDAFTPNPQISKVKST